MKEQMLVWREQKQKFVKLKLRLEG